MSLRTSSMRRWLRRYSLTLVAALGGAAGVAYAAAHHAAPEKPALVAEPVRDTQQDTVQIAILLDTSSSMDGLINQARSELWRMVDELGKAKRVVNGKVRTARVELALYEYGHSTLSPENGFIRQVLPLTGDLDRVSEELQGLTTNGGDEYAGQAIQTAAQGLQWSSDPSALRFIFVAGNEEFDQGPITAASAMASAKAKDITVQLIHCGAQEPTWAQAATLAHTDLMTIDQSAVAVHIPAPQDDEILQIGGRLNDTYIAYGANGAQAQARQKDADLSSANLSPKVALERSQLKGKASYHNESWDVVDAVSNDRAFLANTADDQLPAEMRGKSLEDKRRIVEAKTAERDELKRRLATLEAERTAFLAKEEAKRGPAASSLGSELTRSSKSIAAKKGYRF